MGSKISGIGQRRQGSTPTSTPHLPAGRIQALTASVVCCWLLHSVTIKSKVVLIILFIDHSVTIPAMAAHTPHTYLQAGSRP
jgi:hypothetical protein